MTTDLNRGSDPRDVANAKLRRKRRKKDKKPRRAHRSWTWLVDSLVVLAILLGLLIVLRVPPFPDWLGAQDITLVIGLTLLAISLSFGFVRARARISQNPALWVSYGCPQCKHPQLKRQRSHVLHRISRSVDIPIRRYICPECGWSGTRVDDTHIG